MRPSERREQIVAAARRQFAERGFEGTNLHDVAAAAGVTKPIVYRHFEGKRDLYLSVLDEHLADLIHRLWVALSSSPDPRDRLRAGLEAYFKFVQDRPEGFRMLVEAAGRSDSDARERLARGYESLAEGVARTVGDVLRAADLDPAGAPIYARAMIGMAQSVAEWWIRTRRVKREELVDHLLALTWRGFDGLPRRPSRFRAQPQGSEPIRPRRPVRPLRPAPK